MNTEPTFWATFLDTLAEPLLSWSQGAATSGLVPNLILLALLTVFRKQVARLTVGGQVAILKRLSITAPDKVIEIVTEATSILVVALGMIFVIDTLGAPGAAESALRRLTLSVAVIAVFACLYQLSGPFVSLLRSDGAHRVAVEADWAKRVTQFAITIFGVTSMLKVWSVDISGALTGVGVLGAGLAIAAQDLVRNLIAGMNNMSEKRFETGDIIAVEGAFVGTVAKVDLRSTLIVGFDQIPRYVPNSDLSNAILENLTRRAHRRIEISIPLVMTATADQVTAVRDGLRAHLRDSGDFVLTDDAPQYVHVGELGTSSIDITFYALTQSPDYGPFLAVNERLSLAILAAVAEAGTALAYPTQTVKIDPPAPIS